MKKLSLTLALLLGLTACGQVDSETPEPESTPSEQVSEETSDAADEATDAGESGTWPRTITAGDSEVTIEAQPQRVVALTTETSDIALALAGAERVVAVASGSQTEGTGNVLEEAMKVENAFKVNASPEPEQILALDPDLVITTGRHDNESALADTLAASGVPTLTFDSANFASPDEVKNSITLLGEALGDEEKAAELTDKITADVARAEEAKGTESPRTISLMARGGSLMISGSSSVTTKLIELAGGTSIASEEGWRQSVPADPETLVAINPDVILVQDFRDQGLAPFAELLDNPALSEIKAIAGDRVYLIDAETTSGTASFRIGEGQLAITELLKG